MSVSKILSILQKIETVEVFDSALEQKIVEDLIRYKNQNPDSINDLYAVADLLIKICERTKTTIAQDLIFRIDKTGDRLTSFAQVVETKPKRKWNLEEDAGYFLELQTKKNQDIKLNRLEAALIKACEDELMAGKPPRLTYTTDREITVVPFAKTR